MVKVGYDRMLGILVISHAKLRTLKKGIAISEGTELEVSFYDYVKSQMYLNTVSVFYKNNQRNIFDYSDAYEYLHDKIPEKRDKALLVLTYFYQDMADFLIYNPSSVKLTLKVDSDGEQKNGEFSPLDLGLDSIVIRLSEIKDSIYTLCALMEAFSLRTINVSDVGVVSQTLDSLGEKGEFYRSKAKDLGAKALADMLATKQFSGVMQAESLSNLFRNVDNFASVIAIYSVLDVKNYRDVKRLVIEE